MRQSTDQNIHSNPLGRTLFWACLGIIALHVYGAVVPDATNWGVHQGGFLSAEARIAIVVLMALALSTKGQSFLLELVQRLSTSKLTLTLPSIRSLILLGACSVLLWMFREQTYFLGDGNLIIRTLPNISKPEEVVIAYRNEPFVGWIAWRLYRLLTSLNVASSAEQSFQYLSIFSGVGTLALLPYFMRRLTPSKVDQLLFGLFIIGSGTAQLFFGYVELYAPAAFALFLYFSLSLQYFDGTANFLYPSLGFALLVACHLGMLSLLPSYLYLLFLECRSGRFQRALASTIGAFFLFGGLVLVSGYRPDSLWKHLTGGEKIHLLSPVMTQNFWQPYPLISAPHLIDYLNLFVLVSPFALVFLVLFIGKFWRRERWRDPRWAFFCLTAACGAGFAFLVNPDLGMSRDWDLLSVFILPTVVFAAYLGLLRTEQTISLRTSIAAVVWITLLHTTAWVGLNSSGSRAIERFQALHDARFWSRGALCNAYEELAIYYRNQQDFQRAQVLFEKFLSIDSTNGRVWVSFANLQKLRKDPEMEMRAWERAIQYGITREEALVELGKLYIWNEQLVAGRRLTEAALKLYPRSARLLNNMGVILAKEQQHCGEALPFFLEAIKSDSTAAEPYLNAGLCFEQAQDKTKMRYFLGKFLELAPDAPQAQQVRAALERQASPSRR